MKILTVATTIVLLAPAVLPVGAFDLRPPESRVEFGVKDNRGGFTGETREVSGTVTVRERDGGYAADVEVKVDARTIRTGATLRDAQMRSPAFLNTTAFPFITFSGTVTVEGARTAAVQGHDARAAEHQERDPRRGGADRDHSRRQHLYGAGRSGRQVHRLRPPHPALPHLCRRGFHPHQTAGPVAPQGSVLLNARAPRPEPRKGEPARTPNQEEPWTRVPMPANSAVDSWKT